jgi:hypothetical protein
MARKISDMKDSIRTGTIHDALTGEILGVPIEERTERLKWIRMFKINEFRLFVLLMRFEQDDTRVVHLTKSLERHLQEFLDIPGHRLRVTIESMEKKHLLVTLSDDRLLLNPSYFHRGEGAEYVARVDDFYWHYNEKHGTSLSRLNDPTRWGEEA